MAITRPMSRRPAWPRCDALTWVAAVVIFASAGLRTAEPAGESITPIPSPPTTPAGLMAIGRSSCHQGVDAGGNLWEMMACAIMPAR